ncbi:MAG: PaaI family thioesterase, partial [Gammaproteobacteria bacterium]|nr:PaaI family thioesterase [Gammaproteobacteria bacterium]
TTFYEDRTGHRTVSKGPAMSDTTTSGRSKRPKPPMMDVLGYRDTLHVDRETGRVIYQFEALPSLCHSGGVVQGGFIGGWLDAVTAGAVFAKRGSGTIVSTLELKVSYFRRVDAGMVVTAEGWVEHLGTRIAFMEGTLKDPTGTVVAKASTTARISDHKKKT